MNTHHDSNITNLLLGLGLIDPECFDWSNPIFYLLFRGEVVAVNRDLICIILCGQEHSLKCDT